MATQGLAITLLLSITACGGDDGGGTPTTPPPTGNVVEVSIRDSVFDPKHVEIQPGQTVRWVFRGGMTNHTTTALNGEWDSGFAFQSDGDSFEHTFTTADNNTTFEYFCQTHRVSDQMKGSVLVGNNAPDPDPGY